MFEKQTLQTKNYIELSFMKNTRKNIKLLFYYLNINLSFETIPLKPRLKPNQTI